MTSLWSEKGAMDLTQAIRFTSINIDVKKKEDIMALEYNRPSKCVNEKKYKYSFFLSRLIIFWLFVTKNSKSHGSHLDSYFIRDQYESH